MAFALSHEGRRAFSILILILNTLVLIAVLILTAEMYYISFYMPTRNEIVPKFDAAYVPLVTSALAAIIILICIVAFKVWSEIMSHDRRIQFQISKWVKPIFILHCIAATLLIIHGVVVLIRSASRQSSDDEFLYAMKRYKCSLAIKMEIDNLQMAYRCCGSVSHYDWLIVRWEDAHYQENIMGGNVPFSCCDPWSPRPCLHEAINIDRLHKNYRYNRDLTLYKDGCSCKINSFVYNMLLYTGLLCLFAGICSLFIVILGRLVATSFFCALRTGDPQCYGDARLFNIGKTTIVTREDEWAPLVPKVTITPCETDLPCKSQKCKPDSSGCSYEAQRPRHQQTKTKMPFTEIHNRPIIKHRRGDGFRRT